MFLAGTLPIVGMLAVLGEPDLGLILAGYVGLVLLGGLFLALGGLFSALAHDQIVAFVLAAVAGLVLVLVGHARVVPVLDGWAPSLGPGTLLAGSVSVLPHFEAFVHGLVPLSGLVYFVVWTAVLLWGTAAVVERRRE